MITCKFCNKETPTINHQIRCPLNPDRKMKVWTDEDRKNNGVKSRQQRWTPEQKSRQSLRMHQVVKDNPDSYSKNNVSGRVKMYEINGTKVKGTWELKVANFLVENNIKWTNDIVPYSYFWNNGWHHYFPDFELIDLNILIEVKGYQTDRDSSKWASVKDKPLIVIRKEDLKDLKKFFAGIQAIGQSHKLGPEVSNLSPASQYYSINQEINNGSIRPKNTSTD